MPIRRRALVPLLALLLAPSLAYAQGPCRDFRVEVRQAGTRTTIPGASVRIIHTPGDSLVRSGVTDTSGVFRAPGSNVRFYRVEASAPGFAPGMATTLCPSAGTGRAIISLARVQGAAADSRPAANWLLLARDERVEIRFDGASTERMGRSRHQLRMRWSYPRVRGGDDSEPFRYDRVEIEVAADCRERTQSNGDETYFLGDRVVHTRMGLSHAGSPPVPGSVADHAMTELCKYLTM